MQQVGARAKARVKIQGKLKHLLQLELFMRYDYSLIKALGIRVRLMERGDEPFMIRVTYIESAANELNEYPYEELKTALHNALAGVYLENSDNKFGPDMLIRRREFGVYIDGISTLEEFIILLKVIHGEEWYV